MIEIDIDQYEILKLKYPVIVDTTGNYLVIIDGVVFVARATRQNITDGKEIK